MAASTRCTRSQSRTPAPRSASASPPANGDDARRSAKTDQPADNIMMTGDSNSNEGGLASLPIDQPEQAALAQPTPAIAHTTPPVTTPAAPPATATLAAASKSSPARPRVEVEPELKRSGYGDAHAAREHLYTLQFIEAAEKVDPNYFAPGQKEELLKPWQEKGVLSRKLPATWLDPNIERPETMSLETAQWHARKKDEKEKEFLRRWSRGEIDDNGNPIERHNSELASGDENEDDDGDVDDGDVSDTSVDIVDARRISAPPTQVIATATHATEHTTASFWTSSQSDPVYVTVSVSSDASPNPRKRKSPAPNDHSDQPSRARGASVVPSKKRKTLHVSRTKPTRSSPSTLPPPNGQLPRTSSSSSSSSYKPPAKNPASNKPTLKNQTSKKPRPQQPAVIAPTPLPGRPDYACYTYTELAALCGQRNIMTGGSEHALRAKLIQDDINVLRGLPRDAKHYKGERSRGRKTVPPVVPGAPDAPPAVFAASKKRKRGESDEKSGKSKGNAKRVRFAE